jgi:hypothetical protein
MKHAGVAALERIEGLVAALRALPGMVEKKPGIFYRKGQAFLHFHEDPAGMFMDVRIGGDWARFAVPVSPDAWGDCVAQARRALGV